MGKRRSLELSALVLPTLLLLLIYGASGARCSMVHGNMTDQRSLLDFKGAITGDPAGALHDWNDNIHHCMWLGVSCSMRHPGRVTALVLGGLNLTGQITPSLRNLTFLRELNLSTNHFSGQLPPLNRLRKLENLFLFDNLLQGNIRDVVTALANCSNLACVDISSNMLVGSIPQNIGSLSSLTFINFSKNNLTGNIPPTLSNITGLLGIVLRDNRLKGSIPEELGQLQDMQAVQLGRNMLSGRVPAALFNISQLFYLELSMNMLSGVLPNSVGNLSTTLQALYLGANNLCGAVPQSIGALKNLYALDLGGNNFVGTIPYSIGNLAKLRNLNLSDNHFDGW